LFQKSKLSTTTKQLLSNEQTKPCFHPSKSLLKDDVPPTVENWEKWYIITQTCTYLKLFGVKSGCQVEEGKFCQKWYCQCI
jgi:hypothetical protein